MNLKNALFLSSLFLFAFPVTEPLWGQTVSKKKEHAYSQALKSGERRTITGTVVDAITDEPLIGVSIMLKGSTEGTVTDIDGNFSMSIPMQAELEFSYIGYKKQVVNVSEMVTAQVKMVSDNEVLSEVVVVGAGTQKKVSVTGSISSVKGLELQAPSSALTSNLAGKLAGVIAVTGSGEPGAGSNFYIRGIGTFGGRATPLILLDGVEISSGDLNRIPPESIESFSVLKDASATAIYGARGANGVMLVTTKIGEENSKTKIYVTLENSFLKPVNEIGYVDGARWMEIYNEAQLSRNPNAVPKYSQERIDNTRSGINPYVYPDVDWYDLVFKENTMNQRANVNIIGGGQKVSYYMSLQANHDTGLLNIPKTYSFDNNINKWGYTFQNNIAYKVTPSTRVDLRMNAQIGNNKGPGKSVGDIFYQVYNNNPITYPAFFPAQEGDRHIKYGNAILSGSSLYTNPYAYMLGGFEEANYCTINTSIYLNQKFDFITKGLFFTGLVNWKSFSNTWYTRSLDPYWYRVNPDSWSPDAPDDYEIERVNSGGSEYITQSQAYRTSDNTFYFHGQLGYENTFARDHSVTAMLMYMQREFRNNVLPFRNQGFSGRFSYDFQNKYLAEFNFGYNGTERLKKGTRFEFFPAMSLGWVLSGENFWASMSEYIDFLKIRGSYGLVGSDESGLYSGAQHFLYINNIKMWQAGGFGTGPENNSVYMGGPAVHSYAVDDARWERVKKADIGVDMRILNQVDIAFDYFYDMRDRILLKRQSWPSILGYAGAIPWRNMGKVENKGVELSVAWKKMLFKDFFIDLRGNFTYTQNKYVEVDEPVYPHVWQTQTGKPLSHTVGFIAEGLFRSEEEINASPSQSGLGSGKILPGDIKYRDVNGDGIITQDDKVMISPYGYMPRIQYGLGINMSYKKIDFGVFFNGSAKRTLMISGIDPFGSDEGHGDRNVMNFIADNYWRESEQNWDATYPRLGLTKTQVANNLVPSTYWKRNGNFIRFKTLSVGYSFPHCRIFFSGDNLAVWSPFKHWDPELSYNAYPLQMTLNVGAQFHF
ncbi:MAG: SusC/RagA family TonB-linked outer membrane protein [Bacteroidales bacterium]